MSILFRVLPRSTILTSIGLLLRELAEEKNCWQSRASRKADGFLVSCKCPWTETKLEDAGSRYEPLVSLLLDDLFLFFFATQSSALRVFLALPFTACELVPILFLSSDAFFR